MDPMPISESECRSMKKLKRKCVLITGGDSEIGKAAAYAFAREGAKVMIVYYNEHQDAKETKRHIEDMGECCHIFSTDLKSKCNAIEAVEKHIQLFGKIDVLVNNYMVN